MESFRYVILGGGMVAGYAARTFVEQGVKPGELAIISSDDTVPYERPPLSKTFLAGKETEQGILINPPDFYRQHGIAMRLKKIVETVDLNQQRLQTRAGDEYGWEKLLIATGGRVRKLDVPCADLDGILYLRSLNDCKRIRDAMDGAQRAVVVGGGFIGMEVASVLAQKGLATTLVIAEDRMGKRLFSPEMSEFFLRYYNTHRVTLIPNARVARFTGGRRVDGVVLESGQRLPAGLAVVGIGVVPATDILADTGLALDNGVVVNEFLEASLPGTYAAGDIANYPDVITGTRRRVDHWDNAVKQGQHAARVLAGTRRAFENVPYFFSDIFDLSYEFWGDSSGAERVVYRGDVRSPSFSAWWLKDGRVTAAFVMGRPDEEREVAPEWIRNRREVTAERLSDVTVPLRELERTA